MSMNLAERSAPSTRTKIDQHIYHTRVPPAHRSRSTDPSAPVHRIPSKLQSRPREDARAASAPKAFPLAAAAVAAARFAAGTPWGRWHGAGQSKARTAVVGVDTRTLLVTSGEERQEQSSHRTAEARPDPQSRGRRRPHSAGPLPATAVEKHVRMGFLRRTSGSGAASPGKAQDDLLYGGDGSRIGGRGNSNGGNATDEKVIGGQRAHGRARQMGKSNTARESKLEEVMRSGLSTKVTA